MEDVPACRRPAPGASESQWARTGHNVLKRLDGSRCRLRGSSLWGVGKLASFTSGPTACSRLTQASLFASLLLPI